MRIKALLLLLSMFLLVVSCEKDEEANPNENTEQEDKSDDQKMQEEILRLVNEARKSGYKCGDTQMPAVGELTLNDKLSTAAYNHSKDMNDQGYFSHDSKDGRDPGDRIKAAGYQWKTYGENIAVGYPDEAAVVQGWLKSTEHCKNIMKGSFKEMGVGKSGSYWTQVFGAQ